LPFFNPLSFYSMPLSKIVLFYELKVSLNTMVLIKLCRYQFFQLLFECLHVYVLSYYNRAKEDKRFLEALNCLESKMVDGKIVVERVNRKLSGLSFCKKGEPSELATKRYHEILKNLEKHGS
jgi:hypothetical protein